jgi:hypothetical protein
MSEPRPTENVMNSKTKTERNTVPPLGHVSTYNLRMPKNVPSTFYEKF